MFGVSRTKKVTYALLNYEAMQRIIAPLYVSRGSEHGSEEDADIIGDMLFNFAAEEDESPPSKSLSPNDSDPEKDRSISARDSIVEDDSDEFRNALKAHVLTALQLFAHEDDEQLLLRKVMGHLRELGYDAAVCMTKWKGSSGVTAGEHEFLDVVVSATSSTWTSNRSSCSRGPKKTQGGCGSKQPKRDVQIKKRCARMAIETVRRKHVFPSCA